MEILSITLICWGLALILKIMAKKKKSTPPRSREHFIHWPPATPNTEAEVVRPWLQWKLPKEPILRPAMYRRRPTIMNKSEMAFFYELQKQIPKGYYVFPNMRIADIIDAVDGRGFYNRRNKILPKHIDFLICDSYFKPKLAIEVNGSSHRRKDRVDRDILVKEIFADAKMPLEFVNVGTDFTQSITRLLSALSR